MIKSIALLLLSQAGTKHIYNVAAGVYTKNQPEGVKVQKERKEFHLLRNKAINPVSQPVS